MLHTKPQDALPSSRTAASKGGIAPELSRPDEEEVDKTTEETRLALERIIQTKISAALPAKTAEKRAPVEYIRYTPALQGEQFNSGSKQRLIHMVEIQKDPMEPPRFNVNKKIPRGPPSPPVPVLHSPNRKVIHLLYTIGSTNTLIPKLHYFGPLKPKIALNAIQYKPLNR